MQGLNRKGDQLKPFQFVIFTYVPHILGFGRGTLGIGGR